MCASKILCLNYSDLQKRKNISKLCKLYMIARGHWLTGLGIECGLVFSKRERYSNQDVIGLK